ncbi:MAG: ABC transporter permease subunit [Chloroflexi bacterium]|nr:ABC transporter permease subunit [Chloroflexota bacterium]
MYRLWGIITTEYRMSIRRWGFWIAFGLLSTPYLFSILLSMFDSQAGLAYLSRQEVWQESVYQVYSLNLILPVFAGIIIADRIPRDRAGHTTELLHSTPLKTGEYVLGKYVGSLLSILTPVFFLVALIALLSIANGMPWTSVPAMLVAFIALIVPAYAFIAAFSIAVPVLLPLRIYQILFTGYWFWGNYLNWRTFPTLSGTLLTPNGEFVLEGFFGVLKSALQPGERMHTSGEAILNLLVLLACVVAVLLSLNAYLVRQVRDA